MFDVITIGSATRDVFLKAKGFELRKHADSPTGEEQCFPLGSKIEAEEIVFTTGGGGSNTAVTFARQGLKTACVSVVGEDFNGKEILEEMKKEGVSTEFIQEDSDGPTAYSVILVHSSGERTILSYKGEGQHFNLDKIPFKKLKAYWFFVSSLGGHYDLLKMVIEYAVENKIKIAMNPGTKELAHGFEKLAPIFINVDVLIMNKEEGASLLAIESNNQEAIINKLKETTLGMVVLTDGHNGVRVKDEEGLNYSAGVPDSPIIERTGAGDAFGSGFVSEYIKRGDIKKAIQFATANASSVVTKFGAKAGILKNGDWGPWPLVEVTTSSN